MSSSSPTPPTPRPWEERPWEGAGRRPVGLVVKAADEADPTNGGDGTGKTAKCAGSLPRRLEAELQALVHHRLLQVHGEVLQNGVGQLTEAGGTINAGTALHHSCCNPSVVRVRQRRQEREQRLLGNGGLQLRGRSERHGRDAATGGGRETTGWRPGQETREQLRSVQLSPRRKASGPATAISIAVELRGAVSPRHRGGPPEPSGGTPAVDEKRLAEPADWGARPKDRHGFVGKWHRRGQGREGVGIQRRGSGRVAVGKGGPEGGGGGRSAKRVVRAASCLENISCTADSMRACRDWTAAVRASGHSAIGLSTRRFLEGEGGMKDATVKGCDVMKG
ncbi:hypothetical protein BC829DRAFT_422348 [Chytridium lagenaria]|nr:hypothetical protein BC829DRAFT_422348 [Chytridium lagenaria]